MKKHNSTRLSIIVLIVMLLLPSVSYAIGDPMVVYAFFGYGLLHIVVGCLLVFLNRYKQKRLQFGGLYLINLVVTWLWAINFRGPDFTFMYLGLLAAPVLTFILLHLSVPKNE